MKFAHTVVLPAVHLGGHELHFFCDLTRHNAMEELLATCDTWLDLKTSPHAPRDLSTEDLCYEWAQEKMHATLLGLRHDDHRKRVLRRVMSEFLEQCRFPEVQAALQEYYHADFGDISCEHANQPTQASCLH